MKVRSNKAPSSAPCLCIRVWIYVSVERSIGVLFTGIYRMISVPVRIDWCLEWWKSHSLVRGSMRFYAPRIIESQRWCPVATLLRLLLFQQYWHVTLTEYQYYCFFRWYESCILSLDIEILVLAGITGSELPYFVDDRLKETLLCSPRGVEGDLLSRKRQVESLRPFTMVLGRLSREKWNGKYFASIKFNVVKNLESIIK